MNTLPANLPDVSAATLPATYEAARTQLAECERLDECKDWADKAAALASYAKQANDDELRRMAERIQLRAINRCGELLKAIGDDSGGRPAKNQEGDHPVMTRSGAATAAGLSEHQRKTAVRIASIPRDEFEDAVDSDNPVTVTELAERGTQKRVIDHLGDRDPEEFQMAMYVGGDLRRMAETAGKTDPAAFARGVDKERIPQTIEQIRQIQAWLASLGNALESINV